MSDTDESVQRAMERLRGHVADDRLATLSKLLVAACNYGAGDALAGYQLSALPVDSVCVAAVLLSIQGLPTGFTGAAAAISLLSMTSTDPVITEFLKELDRAALNGQGW